MLEAIGGLYHREVAQIPTDKGSWQLREQRGLLIPYLDEREQAPRDGFCAIYHRGDTPKTIIRGAILDDDVLYETLDAITQKVLEPGLMSIPHRLNGDEGDVYLSNIISGGVLALMGVVLYSTFSQGGDLFNDVEDTYLLGGVAFLGSLAIGARFSKGIGRACDRSRLKHLPPEASGFEYGYIAEEGVLEDYETLLKEIDKQEFRDYAHRAGYDLSVQEVEMTYGMMSRISRESGELESVREHLTTPFPLELAAAYMMEQSPLPTAVIPSLIPE
mgnify:FL=1